MRNTTLDIRPVTSAVGAEILNIDLSATQEENTWREIRQALFDHGVIFFRDQDISQADHVAFTRRFGNPDFKLNSWASPGPYPEITEVTKEEGQKDNVGGDWHTDQSFRKIPIMASILVAREVPEYGGDTLFISMVKAYEALSEGLRHTLEGLRAIHTDAIVNAQREKGDANYIVPAALDPNGEVSHPAVIRHPETGQKSLYITPTRTTRFEGWTAQESKPLLDFLCQHAQRPEFGCRFQWRNGSIAVWENRLTWHYATNDYHGKRREMHRTWVEGSALG